MPVIDWVRNFLGFGWINDLLDIPKKINENKKVKLEMEKLQDDKRERHILTRVTLEDIRQYDPKIQALERRIRGRMWGYEEKPVLPHSTLPTSKKPLLDVGIGVLFFTSLLYLFIALIKWLT